VTYHLIPLPEPLYAIDYHSEHGLGVHPTEDDVKWMAEQDYADPPRFLVMRGVAWIVHDLVDADDPSLPALLCAEVGEVSDTAFVGSSPQEVHSFAQSIWRKEVLECRAKMGITEP
jgi:hypothetical protein